MPVDVEDLDSPTGSPCAGEAEDTTGAVIAPPPPSAQPPSKENDADVAASSGLIVPRASSSPATLLVASAAPVTSVPAAEGTGQPSFVDLMKLAAAAHQVRDFAFDV